MESFSTEPNKAKMPRVAFFAALALFAVANLAIAAMHSFYQKPIAEEVLSSNPQAASHRKEWTWWLARKWLEQPKAPDVVIFGSSQMGSAICAADAQHDMKVVDALLHRHVTSLEDELATRMGQKVSVFSLASPGAMCSDAYMASKALFRDNLKPKVVIIGVGPRDFIDASLTYAASTEPFRFYMRYTNLGKLTFVAYNDVMSWLQFGMDALPCHKLGTYLQAKAQEAPQEFQDGTAGATGLAAVLGAGPAEPGKWLVPANIPQDMWRDNTKEYKNRFKKPNTPVYAAEQKFFDAFLANMQSQRIPVIVVGMPSMTMNRDLLTPKFWNKFRSNVSTVCAMHNAQFLDLTDSPVFEKNDYLDTIHLNASGGAKLFSILAKYASNDTLVAAQLKTQPPEKQILATPPAVPKKQTASTTPAPPAL
jgi:hypothetical protein